MFGAFVIGAVLGAILGVRAFWRTRADNTADRLRTVAFFGTVIAMSLLYATVVWIVDVDPMCLLTFPYKRC